MRSKSLLALLFAVVVGIGAIAYAQTRPSGVLSLNHAVYGAPLPLGVIISTGTSANNHTTAVPFNNTGNALIGKVLLLSPTGSGRLLPATTNAGSTTATEGQATTGVPINAGERVIVVMSETTGWMAWKADTTGDLRVWELK